MEIGWSVYARCQWLFCWLNRQHDPNTVCSVSYIVSPSAIQVDHMPYSCRGMTSMFILFKTYCTGLRYRIKIGAHIKIKGTNAFMFQLVKLSNKIMVTCTVYQNKKLLWCSSIFNPICLHFQQLGNMYEFKIENKTWNRPVWFCIFSLKC